MSDDQQQAQIPQAAPGLMLIELDKEQKEATALRYENVRFEAQGDEGVLPEAIMATAKRIALSVNMHAAQTMEEMATSAPAIFLRGVEHGISEALKVVGGPTIEADKIALAILNQVRKDIEESGQMKEVKVG